MSVLSHDFVWHGSPVPWTFDDDTAARLIGTVARIDLSVAGMDTAARWRSGDLDVLATPRVVALVEEAACATLASVLPPDVTTVGTRIDLRHRAATPVGATVQAIARVTGIEGTRIHFDVSAVEDPTGGARVVAEGVHTRVVVDRGSFLSALAPAQS